MIAISRVPIAGRGCARRSSSRNRRTRKAALPLAAVVTDADDEIQREAIAGELNIFLADKVILKQRRLVIEKRGSSIRTRSSRPDRL
jgi:hypothetical protein